MIHQSSSAIKINRYNAILSVVDHGLSKGVILIPSKKTDMANDLANALMENLFKRFGLLSKIISDRGSTFTSKYTQALFKKLGIEHALSMAYHPQSNGTTGHFNQEIEVYLLIYCSMNPKTRLEALPLIEFSHNSQ